MLPDDLTIDGERLGVYAWRRVASCAVEERALRASWRCDCTGRSCERVPGPQQVLGETWNRCPYPILRSPAWAAVVQLERAMDLGVPPQWPLELAAWLTEAVYGLRLARNRGTIDEPQSGGAAQQLLASLQGRR